MELTLDQALQKGIEAHKAGKAQEADQYYTAILKADPKHPDANHNMGVLAVGVGKVEEALPFFKTALEVNPSIPQYWLSYIDALIRLDRVDEAKAVLDQAKLHGVEQNALAQIEKQIGSSTSSNQNVQDSPQEPSQNQLQALINLYTQGQFEKTLNDASQLLNEFSGSITLYNILGAANQNLGKLEEAIEAYDKAISIKPDFAEAYNNMGAALKEQGKLDDAIDTYNEAISIKPDFAEAYNNMGNALKEQGKLDEAIETYNKVISIKPDYAKAYNNMGNALKEQGKLDEAIEAYNKALAIKPDYAEAYNNMGAALQDQEKVDEAIEAYNKAISIKPDFAEADYNMGNALQDQEKLEEAIEAYNKAISIKPDYAEAYNNMGNALKEQGKLDDAIEAYSKALSIKPDYAEAYNNMGNALKEQGKLDDAIEAYNKAISIKPDYADAYNNMGITLKEQGKPGEAIEAYNKALSIKPDFAEAYNNMGNALKEQDKLDEAIETYNKVISIKPDYAEAYNNMGNALKDQGKLDEAIEAYNKVLTLKPNHGSAKHMLSALTGNTNKTAPREYVENLFNGYSKKFETSLVDKLEYKIPKVIRHILVKPNSNETLGSVLDVGCGTGLLGPEIKNYCSKLEGIDLSNKMLAIAEQKNVYDKLSQFDIVEYLSSMPISFDYYIALDVFIYIGELNEIFRLIKSRNKQPGHLVFSTEHSEIDGYHILNSGRYSHSKSYIESLCEEFEYNISHFSTADLRKDKGHFLTGGIYVLSF